LLQGSEPQKSSLQKSDLIYRLGRNAKSLALVRESDWQTGLSFLDYPYGTEYLTFRVSVLTANGYIVRADGGELITNVWTNEPYIGPYDDGIQQRYPESHVSIWHRNQLLWNSWYEADRANYNLPTVSQYLQQIFDLREKTDNGGKAT
jgi:hypothetical protein